MKKKLVIRCLIGAPIGIAISAIITVIISLFIGDGVYYAVVPELISICKTEINAVLLQTLCSMLYGAAFGGASLIWEKENWSLLKQTLLHLLICSLATFPIAYVLRWMNHSLVGVLIYFGSFFAIYFGIWLSCYLSMKYHIKEINEQIKNINAPN